MTDKIQHPWAKYYADRGVQRPHVASLVKPVRAKKATAVSSRGISAKSGELSPELAAAVAAVTAQAEAVERSATPFNSPLQQEHALREAKKQVRAHLVRNAVVAALVLLALHFVVTRWLYRAPTEAAVKAHIQALPDQIMPFYSTARQPLQIEGVAVVQEDQIDAGHFRYVAAVTLRLRKTLYVPAYSNGTAAYCRLQEALQHARDQDLKLKLFETNDGAADDPEAPTLPRLLQRSHSAGETIVVRVPFTARRFGWQWRLETPQVALRLANREFEGDAIERYADSPYLIYGTPAALAEMRRRIKDASNYVLAVAKEVQKHADVEAVADASAVAAVANRVAQVELADLPARPAGSNGAVLRIALADMPAQPDPEKVATVEARPAIDPDAPAVFLPAPTKFFSPPPRVAGR